METTSAGTALLGVLASVAFGCSDNRPHVDDAEPPGPTAATVPDASPSSDMAVPDAAPQDLAVPDVAPPDAGAVPGPAVSVATGSRSTCAVTASGHVYCWGDGISEGERANPKRLLGLPPMESFDGQVVGCGRARDGRILCVPSLTSGAGHGPEPFVRVEFIDAPWLARALAFSGSLDRGCLIEPTGLLRCWASMNETGAPAAWVTPTPDALTSLDRHAGPGGGCAIGGGREIACWRSDPAHADAPPHVFSVAGLPGVGVQSVERWGDAGCALLLGGAVWCFRLDTPEVPAARVAGLPPARTLSMGGMACVTTDVGPRCWGLPGGALWPGDGTRTEFGPEETGVPAAVDSTGQFASMSVAEDHVCAVDLAGSVRCWGSNSAGKAVGRRLYNPAPRRVQLPARARFIAVRGGFSCAGLEDERVFCWGSMLDGRTCRGVATEVPAFRGASAVDGAPRSALWGTFCARMPDGDVSCLRSDLGAGGRLSGAVSVTAPLAPPLVEPLRSAALPGAAGLVGGRGGFHFMTPDHQIHGLGSYDLVDGGLALAGIQRLVPLGSSLLAYDDSGSAWVGGVDEEQDGSVQFPMARAPDLDGLIATARSGNRTCGIDIAGRVLCAGTLWHRADGDVDGRFVPFDETGDAAAIALTGQAVVCVLRRSGAVDCTLPEDPNDYAALPASRLTRMAGLPAVAALSAGVGSYHICAMSRDGQVYCWLSNDGDALADGPGCQIGWPTVVDLNR